MVIPDSLCQRCGGVGLHHLVPRQYLKDRFSERLSPAVVRVKHRDQVGYFGIYKDGDLEYPFAFQIWEPQSYDEGIGNSMTRSTPPESALRSLIHYMTEMKRKADEQQINPEAAQGTRPKDPSGIPRDTSG